MFSIVWAPGVLFDPYFNSDLYRGRCQLIFLVFCSSSSSRKKNCGRKEGGRLVQEEDGRPGVLPLAVPGPGSVTQVFWATVSDISRITSVSLLMKSAWYVTPAPISRAALGIRRVKAGKCASSLGSGRLGFVGVLLPDRKRNACAWRARQHKICENQAQNLGYWQTPGLGYDELENLRFYKWKVDEELALISKGTNSVIASNPLVW